MGDRFYSQMAEKAKMTPRELSNALRSEEGREKLSAKLDRALGSTVKPNNTKKRVTKKDMSAQIQESLSKLTGEDLSLDISKATVEALETILDAIKTREVVKVQVPEGRLKAPYKEALAAQLQIKEDNFDAVNVAHMRTLIISLNKV